MKHFFALATFIALLSGSSFAQDFQRQYFVMLNTNPARPELPKAELDKIMASHSANIDSLAKAGTLLIAGPFNGGGGMFVIVASSPENVMSILNSDASIKANRFIIEIYPLKMNHGSVCPVKGQIEMTDYQFILYRPIKEKVAGLNADKLEKLAKKHLLFLRDNGSQVKYIAEGEFGAANGGFLIIEKSADESMNKIYKNDPWIKSAYFAKEEKILWIAKGSFCENGLPKQF